MTVTPLGWKPGDRIWREKSESAWAVWICQRDGTWGLCVTEFRLDAPPPVIVERRRFAPYWQQKGEMKWEIVQP